MDIAVFTLGFVQCLMLISNPRNGLNGKDAVVDRVSQYLYFYFSSIRVLLSYSPEKQYFSFFIQKIKIVIKHLTTFTKNYTITIINNLVNNTQLLIWLWKFTLAPCSLR